MIWETGPLRVAADTLAVPAITAQLVNALYNIVDRMYIGHIEGEWRAGSPAWASAFP